MTDDGLGVLMNPTKSSEVTNYYVTDSFAQMAQFAWIGQKKASAWDQLNGSAEQVRAGTAISYLYAWAPKTIAEASANSGHAMELGAYCPKATLWPVTASFGTGALIRIQKNRNGFWSCLT